MSKKKKVKIVIPDCCVSDGQHYYRVKNGRILHVVRDAKNPLINVLYDLRKSDLYVIDDETFDFVLDEAIMNLGLAGDIRNIKIKQVFND